MRRPDGVRARAPFVAISSVWSDLWRSKRVSWPLHRSQMSNVSSDAVTAISRELARPGIIWPSLHADEGGAAERLRRHPRLRKRAPAACTPRVLRPALWSRWKRSESTPWSVPAVDSHFGRGPKPKVRQHCVVVAPVRSAAEPRPKLLPSLCPAQPCTCPWVGHIGPPDHTHFR